MLLHLFYGLLAAAIFSWPLAASARELEWRALEVEARLDDEARLHIRERHEMLFTGDWSGGERGFHVGDGQSLELESIARLGEYGAWVPLSVGSLETFDHYRWSPSEEVLRWRIRGELDAAFSHRLFVYRIEYVLSGALSRRGQHDYTLDHDFAFPERPGHIERFRLYLDLDGSWRSDRPVPIELERGPLAPGESVRLTLPLHYTGVQSLVPPSRLARLWSSLTVDARLWLSLLYAAVIAGLVRALAGRARQSGRSAPEASDERIDSAWVRQHILSLRPEIVGAAYDRSIGEAEVAALLARLEQEGKLTTAISSRSGKVGGRQLELQLHVPRDTLVDYERQLIDKLFLWGDRTSTDLIRSHYEQFNAAQVLRASLAKKVGELLDAHRGSVLASRVGAGLIALAAGVALHSTVVQIVQGWRPWSHETRLAVVAALGMSICFIVGLAQAIGCRSEADSALNIRWLKILIAIASVFVVGLVLVSPRLGALTLVEHLGSAGVLIALLVWVAWPREHAEGMALRRRLALARRYFQNQLHNRCPQLEDAWHPYLIALDLSPEIAGWYRAFGSEPERELDESASSSSSEALGPNDANTSDPARWTGGGGAFGGAGASGSWENVVYDLAHGDGASSSSTSSGGSSEPSTSSETSSRSGGGSGGGW